MSRKSDQCDESNMLIFGVYVGERVAVDVPLGSTVGEVKKMIQVKLKIFFDNLVKQDKKILVVTYAGSDLSDGWIFTDLGIIPGSTVKVCMKEEVKPVLFVRCSHNQEVIEIMDDYNVEKMKVEDLRTIVSKKVGLPVSIFRLVSRNGRELYDGHTLFDYNIECSNSVMMESWDGWNELINYSILGLTPSVTPLIVQDEIQSRFQLKVSLYIAAHFGNVDLARTCIKNGVRPDEPIGEHPSRQWCSNLSHIETLRTPVHEAAEFGQLGVLRLFINSESTCSMARDGNNLTPLNLALRKGQKPCASFLLTKQWARVPVTRTQTMTLQTIRRIKLWCERCKERAFMKHGPNKSSLKKRSFNTGPLVSHGVIVDGFSTSPMKGKAKTMVSMKERRKQAMENLNHDEREHDPESYFKNLTALQTYGPKFRQNTKWGKMIGKSAAGSLLATGLKSLLKPGKTEDKPDGGAPDQPLSPEEASPTKDDQKNPFKLPPIKERGKVDLSQSQPVLIQETEVEEKNQGIDKMNVALEKGRKYIRTGPVKINNRSKSTLSTSMPNMKVRANSSVSLKDTDAKSVSSKSTGERANTAMTNRSRKRKKLPSAMMLPKSNSGGDNAVPLPVVSMEHDMRPFFYHNGVREEDILIPMMTLVDNYQGTPARDRAIKSLAIANTFKEKPWLVQVRMAMNLTSSTLKREVTNLRHSFNEVPRHESMSRSTTAQ